MKTNLTLLLLLAFLSSFGQVKVLKKKDLPGYSHHDTIYTATDVWVQDYGDELNQRVDALDKQRRIDFLRGVMKKKETQEGQLDSLLTQLQILKIERDSLSFIVKNALDDVSGDAIKALKGYEDKIWKLEHEAYDMVREIKRLRKKVFWLWVVVISEGVVMLVLI